MMSENDNKWYGMTDLQAVESLAGQLKRIRLNKNLTQQQVADRAGLDRTTISELENGRPATILTLVQVLRALEKLKILNAFDTEAKISPLQYMNTKNKQRQRASSKKQSDSEDSSQW